MPDITELSDEELKKLYEGSTPAPGMVEGTARAISQGAIGVPNQPKDTAFANDYPIASGGGGMLGRAADVVLPLLGGRIAGRALARGLRPPVNPNRLANQAEMDAVNQYGVVHPRTGHVQLDALAKPRVADAVERAYERADRINKSAENWKRGLQLTGGIAGGAAGGAGGAYLHGEDPQAGALIGGGIGAAPAVPTSVLKAGALPLAFGGSVASGYLGQNLPKPVANALDHLGLAGMFQGVEHFFGKKK